MPASFFLNKILHSNMKNLKELVAPANFIPHFLGENAHTLECVSLPYTNEPMTPDKMWATAEAGADDDEPYNHTLVWKAEGHTFAITVTDEGYYVAYASLTPFVNKISNDGEMWTWRFPEQYVCHVSANYLSIDEIVTRFEHKIGLGMHHSKYTQYFQSQELNWKFAYEAHTDLAIPHEAHMNWPDVFADTGLIVSKNAGNTRVIAKHDDLTLSIKDGEYFAIVSTKMGGIKAAIGRDNLFVSNGLTVLSLSVPVADKNVFIVFMDHEPDDPLPYSRNKQPIVVSSNLGIQLGRIEKGLYNAPRLRPNSMNSLMEFYAEMRK